MWNSYHEQHDIKIRLLSFLLQLATSPLEQEYSPLEISPEQEEKPINWRQVLREGESSPEPLGSESELSEWSDSDSDFDGEDPNPAKTPADVGEFPEDQFGDLIESREKNSVAGQPVVWLRENVQFPYWREEQSVRPDSEERSANMARITRAVREERGELGLRSNTLTEYQVVRELLWMLRSPVETPLFTQTNGEFRVAARVSISSLGEAALRSLLTEAAGTINDVHRLQTFLSDLDTSTDIRPKTFEAYGCGLGLFLQAFSLDLFNLEEDVRKQEETLTTLTVLDKLLPWRKMIAGFRRLHDVATLNWSQAANWESSIRLLSVLHNGLSTNHITALQPYLLDTFLRSLQPYLNIINIWLVEGRLEDWSNEFIFFKDETEREEDEDFWNKVFQSRPYKELLISQNIAPLKLLKGLDHKILVSGKSVEILSKLDLEVPDLNTTKSGVGLYQEFLTRLESQLPKLQPRSISSELAGKKVTDLQQDFQDILSSTTDPFLARAFQEVFTGVEESQTRSLVERSGPDLLLPHSDLATLLPLESLLARSLSPSIDRQYLTACTSLVSLFKTDLELESVLSRARKVFLLEAGDLMQEFCWQLFTSLETEDQLEISDSASLTLLLQDCLGSRYPSWSDLFSCSQQAQAETGEASLSGLRLHMAVAWPLNMVITQQNLQTYNKIFIFLAGVKRSLWSLQSVSLQDLENLENSMLATEDLSSSCLLSQEDVSLCSGAKQHRLQLLRSWLIFFTSTLHGYFMSRVVHSTELELRDNLLTATDLDQIISVHQLYLTKIYDRCFLHASVSTLREAVLMVLNIGLELRRSVVSGLPVHSRTVVAWEEKYRKCHIFLASALQSMTKKMKVEHLESLAVTLCHSCPS